jgi:putative nucleotidyltransferase with HDIG domain
MIEPSIPQGERTKRAVPAAIDALRAALIVAGTAFCFMLLSNFSAQFAEAWGASYLFPPAALSLAAGAAWGRWGVAGVVGGVFLSPWGAATTPLALSAFALVNGLTALVPALALRPARGSSGERLRRLGLYGLLLNNLASAVAGTLTLVMLGRLPLAPAPIADNLFTWWVSDAVACLVLGLPLLLVLAPAILLDAEFARFARAWRSDSSKVAACALLLVSALALIVGLERLGWSHPQWAVVTLVAPIALAASQGGLGAAIWMNLPVCLAYFGLSVLPSLMALDGSPREVLAPAYSVMIFFSAFSVIGGYLAGRNRQLLERVRRQQRQLERDFERTVRSLAAAIEAKDSNTVGHLQRVSGLALRVGEELGLTELELARLRYAALLHDVGKIGVPETVLNKPGPLDAGEHSLMQQHVEIGLRILGAVEVLRDVLPLVQYHQERWDGRRESVAFPGYFGLAGEHIPLGARILAVIDAFDAMTNDRPYRKARPTEDALAELEAEAGFQFDPRVVTATTRVIRAEGPAPVSRRAPSDSGFFVPTDFASRDDAAASTPRN